MDSMSESNRFDNADWWRTAVVYQVYPRSFADANNDGTGDVRGIIDRLDYLADLGIDALWISPWYPSPLLDGGYDVADYCNISPDFGTLADADELIAGAHERGLRVFIDLVPNHCSWEHPRFTEALASAPGSPERDLFHFRDGRGPGGDEPPNDWGSVFGGPAWTRVTEPDGRPGQWYLHLFDISQPDWNWANPAVPAMFDDVLRFWFDRGVDGFRIDVADSMAKDPALPDVADVIGMGDTKAPGSPVWDRPELETIQRRWRAIADSYADTPLGGRVFVSEAYLDPVERLVRYLEPGRLHTTFNFIALLSAWSAASQRHVISETLDAHAAVGAPATWVLGNHDNTRVATRYGKPVTGIDYASPLAVNEDPILVTNRLHAMPTDLTLGHRRARAAAMLELALPGTAYIYQGEELGLGEVEDLPEDALQDPTWERTGHKVRGRDGCRVPLPWSGDRAPFGFGRDADPWLPQPAAWADLTAERQAADPDSTLNLYRLLLKVRRAEADLTSAPFAWHPLDGGEVVAFTRGSVSCIVNFSGQPVELPSGTILAHSSELVDGRLPSDTAVWLRTDDQA